MLVGMPGTEAEMEAKHIEGGVCLEVIQDEEKLLLEGVEVAFRPARRDLLDFAPQEPFQLDGVIGGCEGRGEYVEFWTAHADSGFNHAVMLFSIQFYEFFVGHGLIIFITEKIPYCTMVSNTKETLGTSLLPNRESSRRSSAFGMFIGLSNRMAVKVQNGSRKAALCFTRR